MALIFGRRSKEALKHIHPDLKKIHYRVLNKYGFDHSVLQGRRTQAKQKEYYAKGRQFKNGRWIVVNRGKIVTKLDGVNQKSNHQAKSDQYGYATDSAPYPIDFSNKRTAFVRFYMFAGYMKAAAKELLGEGEITHDLRWGGDWDGDNDFKDQRFNDLPHFELIKPS